MYSIYNAETIKKLIQTVHNIHNTITLYERLFVGQHSPSVFKTLYVHSLGLHHYSINSLLYLTTYKRNILLYIEINISIVHVHISNKILAKGYLPNTLISPGKLKGILHKVRKTLQITNPDYDLVMGDYFYIMTCH